MKNEVLPSAIPNIGMDIENSACHKPWKKLFLASEAKVHTFFTNNLMEKKSLI